MPCMEWFQHISAPSEGLVVLPHAQTNTDDGLKIDFSRTTTALKPLQVV